MRARGPERTLLPTSASPQSRINSIDGHKGRHPNMRMICLRYIICLQGMIAIVATGASFLFLSTRLLRHRISRIQKYAERKHKFLNFTSNARVQAATRMRHQCIQAIRGKHSDALLEYVVKPTDSLFPWESESILLVDPAYHANVGDHMLTIGEQLFLQRVGWNSSILECEYVQSATKVPKCKDHVKEMGKQAKVALWHAGGNWGDLWVEAQWPRIESFEVLLLSGFTVVGMPQSLYYKNVSGEKKQTDMIKTRIMKGLNLTELDSFESRSVTRSRLIFTWREQSSYDQGKKLYPFATNKLVPDIAFQLGPFAPSRPAKYEEMVDIVVFLRDDYESKVKTQRSDKAIRNLLNSVEGGRGLTFKIVDWKDRLKIFKSTNTLFDQTSVKLLSMGKIVICDRLHAAILAYLSGVPFVYLDQISNKVTNTLSVALSIKEGCDDEYASMMARSTSLQDALKKAVEILVNSELI